MRDGVFFLRSFTVTATTDCDPSPLVLAIGSANNGAGLSRSGIDVRPQAS